MMDNALWIASIFGPLMVILGFWKLTYGEHCHKVMTSFKNTPGAFYLKGSLQVLLGIAVIASYNVWMWQPALLVTLLGWAMLIRGVLMLFCPQACFKCMVSEKCEMKVLCVIPLVWGLALCWYAFLK
jgi:hypothetical protein